MPRTVENMWEEEWSKFTTVSESGSPWGLWLHHQRMDIIRNMLLSVDNKAKTIDIGCGSGLTLKLLRDSGFRDSIGIDYAPSAIKKSAMLGFKVGEDTFLIDGKDTKFPDRHFTFVFSEGVWEHFKNPEPFMDEACRLSDRWIMIIQPDHFSFFGRLLHWLWGIFSKKGVFEYSFRLEYFIGYLKSKGFVLLERKSTALNEQSVLLFCREDKVPPPLTKWQKTQKMERDYHFSNKAKGWRVPYSFDYWKNFIDMVDFEGKNLEVGCGTDGIWRFSDDIIGVDTIDFSHLGKNFIQANTENLPFKNGEFRDIYCINMIDHTENPQKTMSEMIRVASHRIYIYSNVFSPYVRPLLRIIDRQHPHHFTEEELVKLVPDSVKITENKRVYFTGTMMFRTAKNYYKFKLLFAHILGNRSLILHLDKEG